MGIGQWSRPKPCGACPPRQQAITVSDRPWASGWPARHLPPERKALCKAVNKLVLHFGAHGTSVSLRDEQLSSKYRR